MINFGSGISDFGLRASIIRVSRKGAKRLLNATVSTVCVSRAGSSDPQSQNPKSEIETSRLSCINYSFNLAAHPPGRHIPHHLVIRNKRPERIFEGCGFIFLNEEMGYPCKPVAGHKTERKVIPGSAPDKPGKQKEAQGCADKMQDPCQGLAVLPHIEIPKFSVILRPVRHGKQYSIIREDLNRMDRILNFGLRIFEWSCTENLLNCLLL